MAGSDWPVGVQRIDDERNALTPQAVAALEGGEIRPNMQWPLNAGYLRHTVWLRFRSPGTANTSSTPLWLLATPTYVDSVTLYQPSPEDPAAWRAQMSGDLVPGRLKGGIRQPLFELQPGQMTLVRIRTTSAMQFDARVMTADELRQTLISEERNMGLFFGVLFALLAAIVGAAALFRTPGLVCLAVLCAAGSLHIFNLRGYASLWAPPSMTLWASHAVGIGAFALTMALAWQIRTQLTSAHRHPVARGTLSVAMTLAGLGMASPILGIYQSVAWINLVLLLVSDTVAISLCVIALRRDPHSAVHALLLAAYLMHALSGAPTALATVGLAPMRVDATLVWQTEIFVFMLLIACAVFAEMALRYRRVEDARTSALRRLGQSEQLLEQRVAQRTSDLVQAQAALAEALESERTLRQEQQHFFQMISHEFRTPLAVIDSAAAEQLSFPTAALEGQKKRGAQIRRACRRLTSLVDSCLITDRMDASGFRILASPVAVADLLEHAAQLVRWSPRHRLRLHTQAAPEHWMCDATLVRIALSNLVDNAVKHAKGGDILVTAARNGAGELAISVADEGVGISPDRIHRMFEQFERGDRADQTRGFGLGLWVARRVARLHGGDIQVTSRVGQGTCFTLTIAWQHADG